MKRPKVTVTVALVLLVIGMLAAVPAFADDHNFTAVAAGGLTLQSQPFLNGTNNPGRSAEDVPGQGSPLSGAEHTVPAVAAEKLPENANPGNGVVRTPPPVTAGKVAPSANSPHPGP